MHSEFIKETKIIEKNDEEKKIELLNCIQNAKMNLHNMYNNMQFVENELTDYYTYQIKAEESKYDYLIKIAKEIDIKKA